MIVDDAHKAVTGLSREMQAGVNPIAIVEFTATPHTKSNILHSVTALELKDEQAGAAAAGKLSVEQDDQQQPVIRITGFMRDDEIESVAAALPACDAQCVRDEVAKFHPGHDHLVKDAAEKRAVGE